MSTPLRDRIDRERGAGTLRSVTVLSEKTDPYRRDTPANHEIGQWYAQQHAWAKGASLADVVLPLARRHRADAYLGAGELSNTLIYRMAANGAEDGRPVVVFTLTDFDPAGRQMSISIARKLQALRDLEFEGLAYHVVPVALTFAQVRRLGLPSTPLKESERRAGKWWDAFGHEQTEVDALAQLQPDTLRRILRRAIHAYRDPSIRKRALAAEAEWKRRAYPVLKAAVDRAAVAALQAEADTVVAEIKRIQTDAYAQTGELIEQLDALALRARKLAPRDLELPPVVSVEPELNGRRGPRVLVTSEWSWLRQTRRLKAYRDYADGEGGEA